MKIVSVGQNWFVKGLDSQNNETLDPIVKAFNTVVNQDLPKNEYVTAEGDKNGCFTVMSMNELGGLDGHLHIRIIELPDTDPFIIIYRISTQSLAEKLRAYLITFHPKAKVVLSPESFLPESTIKKLISMF